MGGGGGGVCVVMHACACVREQYGKGNYKPEACGTITVFAYSGHLTKYEVSKKNNKNI